FVTFCVILATLLGQGLSLPLVIRALGVGGDGSAEREELEARTAAAEAAVGRIEELADEWPTHLPLIDALRAEYENRASHLGGHAAVGAAQNGAAHDDAAEQELVEHHQIR